METAHSALSLSPDTESLRYATGTEGSEERVVVMPTRVSLMYGPVTNAETWLCVHTQFRIHTTRVASVAVLGP